MKLAISEVVGLSLDQTFTYKGMSPINHCWCYKTRGIALLDGLDWCQNAGRKLLFSPSQSNI